MGDHLFLKGNRMKKGKIRAVFFDFDDTLGNRDQYAYDCYQYVIRSFTDLQDEMEIEAVVQQCMIWDQKGDTEKTYVRKMLEKEFGITLPMEDFNDWWIANLYRFCVPYEKSRETLEKLKKDYLLGIITNGTSAAQRGKLRQSGLEDLFDPELIIVSGEYGFRKPDPRLFHAACEKAGVRPEECVYVGDLFRRDVLGAYHAGMTPVWICSLTVRDCRADVLRISRIEELPDILRNL